MMMKKVFSVILTLAWLVSIAHAEGVVADFNGTNGQTPLTHLTYYLGAGGQQLLYGTTQKGGTYGRGTVFSMGFPSHTLTTLYSFDSEYNSTGNPVLQLGTNLYGTTFYGPPGGGVLYQLSQSGSTFTILHTFNGNPDGNSPDGEIQFVTTGGHACTTGDTCIVGTTFSGGVNGYGTIWSYNLTTSAYSVLYSFAATTTSPGAYPVGGVVVDPTGTYLYGTTSNLYNGTSGCNTTNCTGTVFSYNMTTGAFNTVYVFQGGTDGANPQSIPYFDNSGDLLGTTLFGGSASSQGTIWEIASGATTDTILHTFTGYPNDGASPLGFLVLYVPSTCRSDCDELYGTATQSGADGSSGGIVFKLTPSGTSWTYSIVYSFTGEPNGDTPGTAITTFENNSGAEYIELLTSAGGSSNLGAIINAP
jgi:uncharacterized repeat protein (TIGR03803 family)